MKTLHLGTQPVPAMGLGCMGMSEFYKRADWDESIAVLRQAIDTGITLLDTADIYGHGHSEVLVGRAIADRRDDVVLATKFGIDRSHGEARSFRGDPRYVNASIDAGLLRLGTDHVDLYYMHRPPEDVPIEDAVGAMSELVTAGKVRQLGLSEVNRDLLARACSVAPIAALQTEYSAWSRDVEKLVPTLKEHRIGLVAYSPLGRGFLAGVTDVQQLDKGDFRRTNARFVGDAGQNNLDVYRVVADIADDVDATSAQVVLAWLTAQTATLGLPVVPTPGTSDPDRLSENAAALNLTLGAEHVERLNELANKVDGHRTATCPTKADDPTTPRTARPVPTGSGADRATESAGPLEGQAWSLRTLFHTNSQNASPSSSGANLPSGWNQI